MEPRDFQATALQIVQDVEPATEVLVYYTPFEMHMLIEDFLDSLVHAEAMKVYNHIMLVGEFVVWAKECEVQNG